MDHDHWLIEFEQDYSGFRGHRLDFLSSLAADDSEVLYRKYPYYAHYKAAKDAAEDAGFALKYYKRDRNNPAPLQAA